MQVNTEPYILIVEDELLIADHISRVLKASGYKNTSIAINVDEAIEYITKQNPVLVVTDIALGSARTGIDLGNLLSTHYKIPFIYITSHSSAEIIARAKYTRPNAYLVKPFKKEDLLVAIELAMFSIELTAKPNEEHYLLIKDGSAIAQIPHNTILWLKAEGNYTELYTNTSDGGREKKRLIRNVITELHEQLPANEFLRIHRSYVVNKKFINEYKASHVIIKDNKLPVGRTYREFLDQHFK
jgi:two-component system, LytTR family, response regulator LytT